MRIKLVSVCVLAVALCAAAGCGGSFAANQARRQGARSADYYLRKYAEPEVRQYYGDTPETRQQAKQARKELSETIVYGR